jgi:ABC-type bacteriocin/lantibiotic exporter with double-glycine peptidase domain
MGGLVLGLGALHVLIYLVTRRRQRELMADNLQADAASRSYQVELLTGIETLKAMGVEQRAVEHFSNLYVDLLNVNLERGRLSATSDALTSTLRLAAPLGFLAIGALLVMDGAMSLGTMLALNALAAGFLAPVAGLAASAAQFQLLGSYYERVEDVLETPPEQERSPARPRPSLKGGIAVEEVSFRYSPHTDLVIKEVSLEIHPGQLVAIVGSSGAGKSTLAHLLIGLHRPTSGRILYDGLPLAELDLHAVRSQMGVVMQHPSLFGGSIRDNLTLAAPEAPFEEVTQACQLAQIHDDILAMPMGYDSVLADRGASLSGGQRQRLALARALVRRPKVLLLDEATSALDAPTEAKVHAALAQLSCTRVVIAHRLSTVRLADLILVMDKGEVVQAGTHDTLVTAPGEYAALFAAQG